MAKKKHPTKKHKFKYVEPTTSTGLPAREVSSSDGVAAIAPTSPTSRASSKLAAAAASGRDFGYVFGDLRRIAMFAVFLVVLQLVLWYVLGHTSAGDAVYGLIKV